MAHYYYYHLTSNYIDITYDIIKERKIILQATYISHIYKNNTILYQDSMSPRIHVQKFDYKTTINILIRGLLEKFTQNKKALSELIATNNLIIRAVCGDDYFLGIGEDNSGFNVLGIVQMYVRGIFLSPSREAPPESIVMLDTLIKDLSMLAI